MSWTTIIWSMGGGLCLALAWVHFLVWVKSRHSWANLFFSIAAVSAAVISMFELRMMHAQTPEAYGELLHWKYLSIGIITISLVWFIHFYLRGGSVWLVWLYCAWRGLTQILDLLIDQGMYFREITGLRQIPFLDEIVVLPIGVPTPWADFANASNLVLIMIALDGSIAAWRQGNRRRAAVVGSTIAGAVVLGIAQLLMMERGVLQVPYTVSLVFLIIVLGMAYELSADTIKAIQLARDLNLSQERMSLAARAANLGLWEWDVVRDEIWANETSRVRLGVGESERLTFDRFLEKVHPNEREQIQQVMHRILEGEKDLEWEYRVLAPDGKARSILTWGRVEHSGTGKPLLLRGVSMDITERKEAESERIQLRNELAHIQRVSTMGQISSAMAHELNQPLGAILNNASTAQILSSKLKGGNMEFEEILAEETTRAESYGYPK